MIDMLTPDLERLVEEQIASGKYKSATEVVGDALRLQVERDRLERLQIEELRQKIAVGIDQIGRGDFNTYDEATFVTLFEQVKANGRMRLDESRKQKPTG